MMHDYLEMPSPAFSKFRELMDTWDRHLHLENSANDLMDRNGLILFFNKGDDIFGAPEESRLIFAKLKSGDEDDPLTPGWRDKAKFVAMNLLKSMAGDPVQTMFGLNDLDDIKVCDREDVLQRLMSHKPNKKEDKKDEPPVRKRRS
jgi:hypothetical protein